MMLLVISEILTGVVNLNSCHNAHFVRLAPFRVTVNLREVEPHSNKNIKAPFTHTTEKKKYSSQSLSTYICVFS